MPSPTVTLGHSETGPLRVDVPTLIDTRQVITASSGGGKSFLLRRIIELIAQQVQVIAIDPEGEFATLREKFDMLLVGHGGEIAPEVHTAGRLARKLAELRVSAIIDLYDLGDWDARRAYLAPFLDGLMNLPKADYHPIYVAIDEAHQFAPEKAAGKQDSPVAQSRRAIRFLMSAGRKRAVCGALATQRISKLDKDSIADAKNVFIGGITLDVDQERAGDMLGLTKADRLALRDVVPGEFYTFGPAVPHGVSRFRVDPVITTHPRAGQRHLLEVPPASGAIQKITAELADIPRQVKVEEDALSAARRRIGDLERDLRARPVQVQAAPPEVKLERVEVPIFKDGEVKRLEAAISALAEFGDKMLHAAQQLQVTSNELSIALKAAAAPRPDVRPSLRLAVAKTPTVYAAQGQQPAAELKVAGGQPGPVSAPQQRILDALAWLESVGVRQAAKAQLALLADQSPTSSGYTNNLGSLRTAGLITYPMAGTVQLTDDGHRLANVPPVPPTTEELQRQVLARLPRPKAAILQVLIAAYPGSIYKATLAERAGQSPTSSGYTNNLGSLRSLGFIDYPAPGQVVALPVLFLE